MENRHMFSASGLVRHSLAMRALHDAGFKTSLKMSPYRLYVEKSGKWATVSVRRAKRIARAAGTKATSA